MKIRYILIALSVLLVFAFCGCTGDIQPTTDAADATPVPAVTTDAPATDQPAAPTEVPTAEPDDEPGAKPTEEPADETSTAKNFLDNNPAAQLAVNTFISNFAEVYFANYDRTDSGSEAQALAFVYSHCLANDQEAITYEGENAYISIQTVNQNLIKYFGRFLNPEEGQEYQSAGGAAIKYSDGRFSFQAASGEAYNCFAVASRLVALETGNSRVEFEIYRQEITSYLDGGFDKSLYSLTPAEVADRIADGSVEATGISGFAYLDNTESGGFLLQQYFTASSGS